MRCLTRADSARSTLYSSGAGAFAKVDSSAWGITTAFTQHSAHAPAATAWCIAMISDAPGKHWATSTPLPLPTATNPRWKNCPTAMCCFRAAFRADASSTFSTTSASATQPAPGNSNRCSRKKRMEASKRCKTAPTVKSSWWMPETMPHIAPCASLCKVFPSDPDVPMWASTTRRSPRTNAALRNGSITRPRILQQGGAVR